MLRKYKNIWETPQETI